MNPMTQSTSIAGAIGTTGSARHAGAGFGAGRRNSAEEFQMLHQLGMKAVTIGFVLVAAPLVSAQSPLYVPGDLERTVAPSGTVPIGAVDQFAPNGETITQIQHTTSCQFDAYENYHDRLAAPNRWPWRKGPLFGSKGACNCADCSGGCGPNCGGDCAHGLGCGNCGQAGCHHCDPQVANFECANCWSLFDVEKRIILGWGKANAHRFATSAGFNDNHSAQVSLEVLPWVLSDGDSRYTRWGLTTMFHYAHHQGNRDILLLSRRSGRVLHVNGVETWDFIFGPTLRTDLKIGKMRISPNAMVGVVLDWSDVSEIRPTPSQVRMVDQFKYAGFDGGIYLRWMLDFGLTKYMNLGVGMDYRAVQSGVMMDSDEWRKHLGFVLSISHEF